MNRPASGSGARRLLLGAAAAAGGGLCLHWLATMPAAAISEFRGLSPLGSILAKSAFATGAATAFGKFLYATVSTTGVLAASLAIVLLARSGDQRAARHLATALALGTCSAAYFFLANVFPPGAILVAAAPAAGRLAMDALGYAAGLCGLLALLRFFAAYPRDTTPEDWFRFQQAERDERLRKVRTGWRRHIVSEKAIERAERWSAKGGMGKSLDSLFIAAGTGARGWLLAAALALALAGVDAWARAGIAGAGAASPGRALAAATFVGAQAVVIPLLAFILAAQLLKMQHRNGTPEDRRRVDWIYATLFVGGIAVLALPIVLMIAGMVVMYGFPGLAERLVMTYFFPLPFAAAGPLFVLAFVVALVLSVFYRGTVDPRLMARKVTLWGALALLVTFVFVLVERAVAVKLVGLLNLPEEIGPVLAGACVAATFAPVRRRTERGVTEFVSRFLPIELVVEGPRRLAAVAFADLSGYTRLCAHDERQGLLLGALLHRQAERVAQEHGGRLVRSIGDAVMLEFGRAADAAKALRVLHERFPEAARAMGLEPLPVHSGAHYGEVVAPQDDDLFGATVNLAARLQDAAGPGRIVVSEAFRAAASLGEGEHTGIGTRAFKNVPEPVTCHELPVGEGA